MINIKFVLQKQRSRITETNYFLFYLKIVYEIDSLQQEIDQRRRTIPQTYKEALNRADTIHEINRLYDSCERAARRFRTTAEIMIEQKHPEYEQVEREIKDVEKKLSIVYISVGDYREQVDKTNTYYKLIDEV
jgi:hypothetical protein